MLKLDEAMEICNELKEVTKQASSTTFVSQPYFLIFWTQEPPFFVLMYVLKAQITCGDEECLELLTHMKTLKDSALDLPTFNVLLYHALRTCQPLCYPLFDFLSTETALQPGASAFL